MFRYYSLKHSILMTVVSFFLFFSGTGAGVRFWLRGTTYQNNSLVTLEEIGEWEDALFCVTGQTGCCRPPYYTGSGLGHWFFPNGSRIPSSWGQWDFYRTRGQLMVNMHRRRGGVTGIYSCEIPDARNVILTIYIGVYTADTGEWYILKSQKVF